MGGLPIEQQVEDLLCGDKTSIGTQEKGDISPNRKAGTRWSNRTSSVPPLMVPPLHGLARVGGNSIALCCGKSEIEFNMETVANVDIQ
jgi:hypothetical protein